MINRGNKYREAIQELKKLSGRKNLSTKRSEAGEQYKKLRDKICKNFSISVKTVYRDLRRKVPGLRKNRSDRGKYKSRVSNNELKVYEEIIMAGKSHSKAKEKAKISNRKSLRIREKLSTPSGGKNNAGKESESMFGKNAKIFFEKIFDFDLIAPEKEIKIKNFSVPKEDLKDIILVLANAYNRQCFADKNKLKVSRQELRDMMMHHLVEEQIVLARDAMDYKMIESITRMLDRLNEDKKLPDDFATIIKLCKELKPDINENEIVRLIKKVSDL